MYKDFFGLSELPFTIVPSSRYLFLSARHREAMNHLQAGLGGGGGFALLTGEVGTGKTTVSKALLAVLEDNIKTGLLLNPTYTGSDLLEAICDEFSIEYQESASLKQLTESIYRYLINNHGQGLQTLLLIDEAQHLSAMVLEQLRLLTNLETESQKLLKVLLIGQPELQYKLQTEELRQLAQRITGRYHLLPLTSQEVAQYIQFRIQVAGGSYDMFTAKAIKHIAKQTHGVPRLINLVCDKCLLYAYYGGEPMVSGVIAEKACADVMIFQRPMPANSVMNPHVSGVNSPVNMKTGKSWVAYGASLIGGLALAVLVWFYAPQWLAPEFDSQLSQSMEAQDKSAPSELAHDVIASTRKAIAQDGEQTQVDKSAESLISPYIKQSHNPINAMQTLFGLWGYQVEAKEANCRQAPRADLYCYQGTGNLNQLAVINRPTMLTLQANYQTYFAILYRVNESSSQLLLADKRIEVPNEWLKKHWNGEYQLLWHSKMADQVLKINDTGEYVSQLNKELSQALGGALLDTTIFNQDMKSKVEAFQMWQGINVDGIAGKETLMLLDSYTNLDAPRLMGSIDGKSQHFNGNKS
ncbi:AAA family ATPase [Vibrio sp. S17_S38]|uniref:ExeA family protein n=1 Tax=Vibrio sp. S17_S38 TaxID=2720229 RepID=UPI001680A134|nr:ExeA family protein [Vibrio sp. S17_S38]MBD1572723.1 AAA family ATPase [Vibrio sp. S17_S38]